MGWRKGRDAEVVLMGWRVPMVLVMSAPMRGEEERGDVLLLLPPRRPFRVGCPLRPILSPSGYW